MKDHMELIMHLLLGEVKRLRAELKRAMDISEMLHEDMMALKAEKEESAIELSPKDVMEILEISKTTLYRWRREGVVRCVYDTKNQLAYPLSDLYASIRSGRATCRGFSRKTALERLDSFKVDKLKVSL